MIARSTPLIVVPLLLAGVTVTVSSSADGANVASARPAVTSVSPSLGSTQARQRVTIRGSGFAGVTQVDIGSTRVGSFEVVNSTTVVVYAPPRAHSTRHVHVTTAAGISRPVQADQYTYVHGFVPSKRLVPHLAPLPPDAGTNHYQGDEAVSGWSCGTSDHCVAVGSYDPTDTGSTQLPTRALALTRTPGNVSVETLPAVTGGTTPTGSLTQVSCVGADFCAAVGVDANGVPVLATLSGGTWTVRRVPDGRATGYLGQSAGDSLNDVSCAAAGDCVLVGTHGTGDGSTGLVYTLSDGSLTVQTSPQPANSSTPTHVTLGSVVCVTTSWCEITGGYSDATDGLSLAVTDADGTLSALELFGPHGEVHASAGPLSCPAVGRCYGAGDYQQGAATSPLAEVGVLDGSRWQALAVPGQADAAADADSLLNDIACPAVGSCFATGYYDAEVSGTATAAREALVLRLTGSTITVQAAPIPPSFATIGQFPPSVQLASVSCHSSTSCVAVGAVNGDVVSETWTKADVWVPGYAGRQSGAASDTEAAFQAVTCPAYATCLVAGEAPYDFNGGSDALQTRNIYSIAVPR